MVKKVDDDAGKFKEGIGMGAYYKPYHVNTTILHTIILQTQSYFDEQTDRQTGDAIQG